MEFEYSDKNSRRSKVYIAVGVIVALLVAATVYIALQASGLTSQGEVEMRQVVVAAAEIPGRKAIEEADVVMRNVPVDPINETAFTSIDEVLGRVVSVPVSAGQLLTPNLLASTDAGAMPNRSRRASSTSKTSSSSTTSSAKSSSAYGTR